MKEVAFTLPVGEISQILETSFGLCIVMVSERTEDRTLELEEIREPLRRMLEDRKYQADLEKFMIKARDEAEWCVRPKYHDRLTISSPECRQL